MIKKMKKLLPKELVAGDDLKIYAQFEIGKLNKLIDYVDELEDKINKIKVESNRLNQVDINGNNLYQFLLKVDTILEIRKR